MTILQIEHRVPNFEGWKKAFESDPVGRKKSGVKSYRIYRLANDQDYIIIDLVFENEADASNMLLALQKLWVNVEGTVINNAKTRMLNLVEQKDY